jgi:multiple sugar transport system permease protein
MISSFVLMRLLGWIDTYYALIVPGLFSAFGTFLMRQFFMTIPDSLAEAATIDGSNPFGIYWRIMLPLAKPALATLTIFTFMGAWNDFMWPLIVTNSDRLRVISLGISAFQDMYYTEWTYLMAAAVMAMVPTIAVYIGAQRYFVQGIAMTGIKG